MAEGLVGRGKLRGLQGAATGVCEPAKNRRAHGCGVGRVMWGDWGLGNGCHISRGCSERLEQVPRAGQGQAVQKRSCREEGVGALAPGHTLTAPRPPEVVADETPAVQAVLRADTKRLKLLEEERRLQGQLEQGDDTAAERLEKVEEMAQGTWAKTGGSRDPPTCVLFSLLPGVRGIAGHRGGRCRGQSPPDPGRPGL